MAATHLKKAGTVSRLQLCATPFSCDVRGDQLQLVWLEVVVHD